MRIEVVTILVRLVFVDSPILEALFLLVEGVFDELSLLELDLCLILVILGESLKEKFLMVYFGETLVELADFLQSV